LAGAGPQQGTRRPLLPAYRRHGRGQPRLLRRLRALVQVQEAGGSRRRGAGAGGKGRSASSCLNAVDDRGEELFSSPFPFINYSKSIKKEKRTTNLPCSAGYEEK